MRLKWNSQEVIKNQNKYNDAHGVTDCKFAKAKNTSISSKLKLVWCTMVKKSRNDGAKGSRSLDLVRGHNVFCDSCQPQHCKHWAPPAGCQSQSAAAAAEKWRWASREGEEFGTPAGRRKNYSHILFFVGCIGVQKSFRVIENQLWKQVSLARSYWK